MRVITTILSVALVAAAVFYGGFFYAKRYAPTLVERTDTLYVDREITRRDTVTVVRPVTRTVYRETRDTIRVMVPIPRDFRPVGVVSNAPVRFDGPHVVLTYFAPDLSTFVQDRFVIPPVRREAYFAPTLAINPFKPTRLSALGFEAGYRINALTGYVRAEAIADGGVFLTLGLRVNVFHRTYR